RCHTGVVHELAEHANRVVPNGPVSAFRQRAQPKLSDQTACHVRDVLPRLDRYAPREQGLPGIVVSQSAPEQLRLMSWCGSPRGQSENQAFVIGVIALEEARSVVQPCEIGPQIARQHGGCKELGQRPMGEPWPSMNGGSDQTGR